VIIRFVIVPIFSLKKNCQGFRNSLTLGLPTQKLCFFKDKLLLVHDFVKNVVKFLVIIINYIMFSVNIF